jgi:hypothetical protein
MDLIAKAREEAAKALKMDYGSLSGDMVATNICIYILFVLFYF